MIVMENPMPFTIVNAVPFTFGSQFCATRVENSGESATTVAPQKSIRNIKIHGFGIVKNNGESKQHKPDVNRAADAIVREPFFNDQVLPITQPTLPAEIMAKVAYERGRFPFWDELYVARITGTNAQNA
jgi:hypothetical protein